MKVTIYYQGDFGMGINKIEARDFEFIRKPYAQYPEALYLYYVRKGCRKRLGFVRTSGEFLLVLDGWGHPEPAETFTNEYTGASGLVCQESRYTSFDESWTTEFMRMITQYMERKKNITVIVENGTKENQTK